jgi:hypothetical protein
VIIEALLFLCIAIAVFLPPASPPASMALRIIGLILTVLFILQCLGLLDGLQFGSFPHSRLR